MKKIKVKAALLASALMVFALNAVAFAAAATVDIQSAISTGVSSMQSDVMAIIGTVIPAVMAITVAIIGIKKGISVFKSLTSK